MEEKVDEWELLPPNTCFLDLGLADIKDLFSKEIDYTDYFIEQPVDQHLVQTDNKKPFHQHIADEIQVYREEFVEEIEVEDSRQTICEIGEIEEENGGDDEKEEEDLGKKPRSKRPLVAGIGDMLSIGAAVAAAMLCGFLLGGRRQEQLRRADAVQFHDKALKQMVRRANGMNQVLVAKASGMPPPAMQPAAISFGGCFEDML